MADPDGCRTVVVDGVGHSPALGALGRRCRVCALDVRHHPVVFDGGMLHGSLPFDGPRISVVLYYRREAPGCSLGLTDVLHDLEFPVSPWHSDKSKDNAWA